MPEFGPFYPRPLQDAVNHAERLAMVLRRMPTAGAVDDGSAWVTGRAEEIACFVGAVTRDWRAKHLTVSRAARDIGSYVEGLHDELRAQLAVDTLPCCAGALDDTSDTLTPFSVTFAPGDTRTPGTTTLLRGLDYSVAERSR